MEVEGGRGMGVVGGGGAVSGTDAVRKGSNSETVETLPFLWKTVRRSCGCGLKSVSLTC